MQRHPNRAAPPGTEFAGPWIRLAALVIDSVLLFVLVTAASMVGAIVLVVLAANDLDASALDLDGWPAGFIPYAAVGVVALCWYAAWQASAGWTPGMKLLQLRVLGAGQRDKPSVWSVTVRNLPVALVGSGIGMGDATLVDVAVTVAGLIVYAALGVSIAKDPMRRGLHDRLAGGTTVVRGLPAPMAPQPAVE